MFGNPRQSARTEVQIVFLRILDQNYSLAHFRRYSNKGRLGLLLQCTICLGLPPSPASEYWIPSAETKGNC